ncbi:hypothetical protein BLOT_014556 [Blomia tropicalis]|nr:hypothetical protein BLOT_014556 [Blomia tropicalis]
MKVSCIYTLKRVILIALIAIWSIYLLMTMILLLTNTYLGYFSDYSLLSTKVSQNTYVFTFLAMTILNWCINMFAFVGVWRERFRPISIYLIIQLFPIGFKVAQNELDKQQSDYITVGVSAITWFIALLYGIELYQIESSIMKK